MEKLSFSRIPAPSEMPDLIGIQKRSFTDFLQKDVAPEERKLQGLQAAFHDVFPISNADDSLVLEFVSYSIGEPEHTIESAIVKDATYAAPIQITLRLIDKGEKGKPRPIPEQTLFLATLPLMTETGTFVINGAERVIVSQLHRSPEIIFQEDEEKKITSYGKRMFTAAIIPYRGKWIEFEFDQNNVLFVKLDKKRKLPATVLLRALGYEKDEEILRLFYEIEDLNLDKVPVESALEKRVSAQDVVDKKTGEVLLEVNQEITKEAIARLHAHKVKTVPVLKLDPAVNDVTIRNTLPRDQHKTKKDALKEIYRRLSSQDYLPAGQADVVAESMFETTFFKGVRKYDLTRVGRYKINKKLRAVFESLSGLKEFHFKLPAESRRTLCAEDIIAAMKYLIGLNNGTGGEVDDIDHLGNRRVRGVGELLENQIRSGISGMARLVRDKMNAPDHQQLLPSKILNTTPVASAIRRFFGSSQLSQFMDQTNPLAELTHKRRLSALGPGGLHRKRAGFEVRDVHHTHYGRICPIETPEGPNIGLITSLACYSRVNAHGLIESPYRVVRRGKVTEQVEYLTADKEDEFVVAQANSPLDKNGRFASELVAARHRGDFPLVFPDDVHYMDISPMQVVSVSTALIPFLEHDDANRALMGSNMQRQAVPLMVAESPLVGTGIEGRVARDSGVMVTARRGGEVISVSGDHIAVWSDDGPKPGVDLYRMRKYARSNQDTCINQTPITRKGQKVKRGDVLADGPATHQGELALGKNLLVCFMPWEGYNFEDAILLSERVAREDVFTSLHIQEFQIEARDLNRRAEEITRDIPNVGEEALGNLDENGVIRIGAEVLPGDILVGKVTPKGEQQSTPEERLLKVIFGRKAEETRDASLRVPPGVTGTVLDVQVLERSEHLGWRESKKRVEALENEYRRRISALQQEHKKKLDRLSTENLRGEIAEERRAIKRTFARLQKDHDRWLADWAKRFAVSARAMNKTERRAAKKFLGTLSSSRRSLTQWLQQAGIATRRLGARRGTPLEKGPGIEARMSPFEGKVPDALWLAAREILARARELEERTREHVARAELRVKAVEDELHSLKRLDLAQERVRLNRLFETRGQELKAWRDQERGSLKSGDELQVTVNKLVKVFIISKRKVSVGDKLAGRHGNKGVVSAILPLEDMPHLPDGTPVDMVLSPLSVPSRMNVGQILETMLGWAARHLNLQMVTPVFDGATEEDVRAQIKKARETLSKAGMPEKYLPTEEGKFTLIDGRTGEPFSEKVTVGHIYIMKLSHLVEDKIHARSTGPYSLITRQPLGGKAQFGGQRFGEMEVWAVEGYGAAYTLQEFLTVKSDDVTGRTRMYESIIKGEMVSEPGVPESFKVLVKELQSLCLNVELMRQGGNGAGPQVQPTVEEKVEK